MLAFSVAAGSLLVLLIAAKFWWQQKLGSQYRLPPGPKRNPIFGNLFELISSTIKGEAPFVKFAQWAFQYGPVCYLRFFRQRVLVISDAKVAQQLCVGQADKFSTRPTGLFLAQVLKGKGIVFNDGGSWKEHRHFITQEFRKYGFGHHSLEQRIQYVVDEYVDQITKTNGQPHNSHFNLATAVYNIIWTVISGDQFKWDDPFLCKLITNLDTNLQAVELVGPHNYVSVFMFFNILWHGPFRLFKITTERFNYFKQLLTRYKNGRKGTTEMEESMIYDYLALGHYFLISFSKSLSASKEDQLLWLVSDLFIAGGETTITTLRWLFLCLAAFPEKQERVRKEIAETFGRDSTPAYSQRFELPYTEAFIHEVLRFCGVTPGMWRSTTEDTKYDNYDIPKDTWVLLHFWAMSHNATQWENAQEFKPERFLKDDGTFGKNDDLLAFSTGRRQCPGEGLARTELFLFTVGIVQKFKVVLAPGHENVDIHGGHFGVTYMPPHHLVQFIPM